MRRFLEQDLASPLDISESQGYSVLDFSLWAEDQGVEGAKAVTEYVLARWPEIPCRNREVLARRRGLCQEITDGFGFRLLQQMGWRPGEPLGLGRDEGALRTPLTIPEPRRIWDKRGLQQPAGAGSLKRKREA